MKLTHLAAVLAGATAAGAESGELREALVGAAAAVAVYAVRRLVDWLFKNCGGEPPPDDKKENP